MVPVIVNRPLQCQLTTRVLSFIVAFLILAHASQAATAESTAQERVTQIVEQIASKRNVPSITLAIQTESGHFECEHHHSQAKQQTIYGIGSTTKLLSAVLVMHYVQEGRIGVDQSVTKYMDASLIDSIQGIDRVTVRQLLQHTSGLSDYANNPEWMKRVSQKAAPITFSEKLKLVKSELRQAGQFAYSNTNYLFLEQVIQTVTKKPYAEAFDEFYARHGLRISMGSPEATLQAFFAKSERGSSDVSTWNEHYGFDGGAYTTPRELCRFLSKLFVEQTLLSPESLQQMQEWNQMPKSIPIGIGSISHYGSGLMKLTHREQHWLGHAGGTLKYQSFAFYDADNSVIVALTTNCAGLPYSRAFYQELLPAILKEF